MIKAAVQTAAFSCPGRARQAQFVERVHQPFRERRSVDLRKQQLFVAAGFETACDLPVPEFPLFVVMFGKDDLAAEVRQKPGVHHVQVVHILVGQFERLLQRIAAAPFAAGDDAFPLLVAHLVEAGAYQVVLVGEHFVEGAFRDSQRLRDLIDPDGTNAVSGDEFPRGADDLLLGRSPFHYFSSVMSRPPPRAW